MNKVQTYHHCLQFKFILWYVLKISTLTVTVPCSSMESKQSNLMDRVVPWLNTSHLMKLSHCNQLTE